VQTTVRQGELVLSHEENRWTITQLACKYLRWLNRWYRGKPIALLWDLFAAQRCSEAKELAPQLNIRLDFIPARATGEYQPLDRRIFGPYVALCCFDPMSYSLPEIFCSGLIRIENSLSRKSGIIPVFINGWIEATEMVLGFDLAPKQSQSPTSVAIDFSDGCLHLCWTRILAFLN
jgi:hypothetical protein